MLALPAVAGSAITLVLVNVFPARRTRDLLSIVALGAAAGVILLFRLIRPEQLARPEGFRNLLDFITVLRTPTSPFLPSEWAAKAIMGFLRPNFDPLPLLLLWSPAAARREAGVRAQGREAVFPRHHAVEPADPARRPRRRVPVQHQGAAAASRRAGGLLLRDPGVVSQPRPVRVRARVDRGPLHLPGGLARGPPDVAAALEPARSAGAPLVQVLGGDRAAPGSGHAPHRAHGRVARGLLLHDDPEPRDDLRPDPRDRGDGEDRREAQDHHEG